MDECSSLYYPSNLVSVESQYIPVNTVTVFIFSDAGRSFGELALISEECVRNATIITDDPTDLLVVDRALYNRSLHAAQAAEFEERTRFVTESPLFRGWPRKYKRQMAMSIVRETINFDESIVKQGDPASHIYFIVRYNSKLLN